MEPTKYDAFNNQPPPAAESVETTSRRQLRLDIVVMVIMDFGLTKVYSFFQVGREDDKGRFIYTYIYTYIYIYIDRGVEFSLLDFVLVVLTLHLPAHPRLSASQSFAA